jgi:hypothetical protein
MRSVPKEKNRKERCVLGRVGMSADQAMHRVDRAHSRFRLTSPLLMYAAVDCELAVSPLRQLLLPWRRSGLGSGGDIGH